MNSPHIAALLLAAGPSSRLGQPKQLVRVGNQSLVRRATRLLLAQESVSVTVVVGFDADRIKGEIQDLPVTVVENREWCEGMGGSISCGVGTMTVDADGILLMLCDQWCLEESDIAGLISAWSTDISEIYIAQWNEGKVLISGPPVIFPRKIKQELINVDKYRGARQLIDRHKDIVQYFRMENAALDLDRPEDFEQLIKLGGQSPSS